MLNPLNLNNNILAMNTRRHLNNNSEVQATRIQRLASGLRINNADDDASGLYITEGFRTQITGMVAGVRNAEMSSNLLQVAEGTLNEVGAMLNRMKELAIESANSTMNDLNREAIEAEVSQLKTEVDRMARSSVYNDQAILTGFGSRADETLSTSIVDTADTGVVGFQVTGAADGEYTFEDADDDGLLTLGNGILSQTIDLRQLDQELKVAPGETVIANFDRLGILVTLAGQDGTDVTEGDYVAGELNGKTVHITGGSEGTFQIGPDNVEADRLQANLPDMKASGSFLNLNAVSLSTQQSAKEAIGQLGHSLDKLNRVRADIGSLMNRLQHHINVTENSIESNTASEGALRDADIAREVTQFTSSRVLQQAATAMLAQANLTPQSAIGLLAESQA